MTPEFSIIFAVSLVQIDEVDPGSNVTLGLGFTTTVDVKLFPEHPAALGVIV